MTGTSSANGAMPSRITPASKSEVRFSKASTSFPPPVVVPFATAAGVNAGKGGCSTPPEEFGPEVYSAEQRRLEAAKAAAAAEEDYELAQRLTNDLAALHTRRAAFLEREKVRAVADEDYDLAKKLKVEIEALANMLGPRKAQHSIESADERQRQAQIASKEAEKARAVTDEDFELAKQLKLEIEVLRKASLPAQPPPVEESPLSDATQASVIEQVRLPVSQLPRGQPADETAAVPAEEEEEDSEDGSLPALSPRSLGVVPSVRPASDHVPASRIQSMPESADDKGKDRDEEDEQEKDEDKDEDEEEEVVCMEVPLPGDVEDAMLAQCVNEPQGSEADNICASIEQERAVAADTSVSVLSDGRSVRSAARHLQEVADAVGGRSQAAPLSPLAAQLRPDDTSTREPTLEIPVSGEFAAGALAGPPTECDRCSDGDGASEVAIVSSPPIGSAQESATTTTAGSCDGREEQHDEQRGESLQANSGVATEGADESDDDDEVLDYPGPQLPKEEASNPSEERAEQSACEQHTQGNALALQASEELHERRALVQRAPIAVRPQRPWQAAVAAATSPRPPAAVAIAAAAAAEAPPGSEVDEAHEALSRLPTRIPRPAAAAAAARAALQKASTIQGGFSHEGDASAATTTSAHSTSPTHLAPEPEASVEPDSEPLETRELELYSLTEGEPRAAMRVGKKVKITGSGPYQGRFGIVMGFDEDGDPELRLDDGDIKVFYRSDISIANEVRRRPQEVPAATLAAPPAAPSAPSAPPVRRGFSATMQARSVPKAGAPQQRSVIAEEEEAPEAQAVSQAFTPQQRIVAAAEEAAPLTRTLAAATAEPTPAAPRPFSRMDELDELNDLPELENVEAAPSPSLVSRPAPKTMPAGRNNSTYGKQYDDDDDAEEHGFALIRTSLAEELRSAKLKLARAKGHGRQEGNALLAVAELELALGKNEEVSQLAADASAIFEELGDQKGGSGQVKAARLFSKLRLAEEAPEEAHDICKSRLDQCVRAGNRAAEALARLALADVHTAMERHKEAVKEAALAQQICKELKDHASEADALQALANANMRLGSSTHIQKGSQFAEEALSLVRALGDSKEEAAALLIVCRAHLLKQENEEAYGVAESAVTISRHAGCKRSESLAQREVANVLLAARLELDMALQASEDAVRLAAETGDVYGEIAARHVAASAFVQNEQLAEALDTAEIALALARELKDRRSLKESMDVIIQLKIGDQQNEKALEAAQEELELAKGDDSDPHRVLIALQRVVSLQLAMEEGEAAQKTAEQAIELEKSGDRKAEALGYQLVAEAHLAARRHQEALTSANKALAVLQEMKERDVRAIANLLQMMFELHVESNNESEALRARHALRLAYQAAGWRDEEATTLLGLAELILQVRGPREAMKSAKEAVALYKDLGDQTGEASGMLVTAQCQVAMKASTDALRSTVTARRVFQSLSDAAGEASSLLTASDIYSKNGAADEAVRVAREAQKICQKGGETKAEADALQAIAAARISVLQRDEESGRVPKVDDVKQAAEAAQELITFLEPMTDMEERRISCLSQLSSLRLMAKEHDAALKAAEEALDLAVRIDRALPMGNALLATSEAHCSLGNSKDALQAAEDAVSVFEQLGDRALLQAAQQAVEAAKKPPPEKVKQEEAMPAQKPRKGAEFVNRELQLQPGRGPIPQAQAARQAAAGPRRGFSAVAEEVEQTRPNFYLRSESSQHNEPDQEERRQQLMAATDARSMKPKIPQVEQPQQSHLRSVLQKVRPDWTGSEVATVQQKLAAIQIDTLKELQKQLNDLGARGLNDKLKDVGKRPLKVQTLETLRDFEAS